MFNSISSFFNSWSGFSKTLPDGMVKQSSDSLIGRENKPELFNELEKEYDSLAGRCLKINIFKLTDIPVIGDLLTFPFIAVTGIWRTIFSPQRRVPPLGLQDTMRANVNGPQIVHSNDLNKEKSFWNFEVLRIHKLTISFCLDSGNSQNSLDFLNNPLINLQKDEYGRCVLLQAGVRGCTSAVTAMMMLDSEKKCNISKLRSVNLGTTETMVSDLKNAGLQTLVRQPKSIHELRDMIASHGSAIVSVDSIGSHVILVDEISRNTAKIRDPFHGWSITIPLYSLTCRLNNFKDSVIQLQTDE